MAPSTIRFFRRDCVYLDTVEADVTRSWLLSRLGECSFIIPWVDPKLNQALVEFGNIIYITNPFTKPWVGICETDREWPFEGPRIKGLTAEILLSYRNNLEVDTVNNLLKASEKITGSAGELVKEIVLRANADEDTMLRPGNIWTGGQSREETLISDYYTHVSSIAGRSGCDFDVTATLPSTSLLSLAFNFYEKKGQDKSGFITLEEGVNMQRQDATMIEQGPIANSIIGIGSAANPVDRLAALHENALSRRRFGLRQKAITYPDVTQIDTLAQNVRTQVGLDAFPSKNPRISITDPSLFKRIDEGDIVRLVTHTFGFGRNGKVGIDVPAQILGYEINDNNGVMDAVVDSIENRNNG